ncbi:MAG: VRR-NUC domain-containing protein [FCB group bacterium]|nr:VRR-NUC domain-containing protein [FCB group bacterium]
MAKKNNSPFEAWEQEQFFKWVYSNQIKYPELQLINGSMNGVRVSPRIRATLKAQGLRPGVPDIDVPIARLPYHGLRIELKRQSGGQVSQAQKHFHEALRKQGYLVHVCCGWREAVESVKDYLTIWDGIE